MPVSLSPLSGAVLINTYQDVFVTADITANGFETIDHWEWDIQGITANTPDNPPNIIVTPDNNVLHVHYANYEGLFNLINLRYLLPDGTPVDTSGFDLLPPAGDAPEITEMIASSQNLYVWEITATVHGTMLDTGGVSVVTSETGTYTIRIEANYSINRDTLIAQVDARS